MRHDLGQSNRPPVSTLEILAIAFGMAVAAWGWWQFLAS